MQACGAAPSSVSEPVISFSDVTVDTNARCVLKSGERVHLAARNTRLLELAGANDGAASSTAIRSTKLYDEYDENISNAVEVYVSNLRKKLGKTSCRPFATRAIALTSSNSPAPSSANRIVRASEPAAFGLAAAALVACVRCGLVSCWCWCSPRPASARPPLLVLPGVVDRQADAELQARTSTAPP